MGRQLQKFWKHQVLFAEKAPLVMSPAALHPVQQLHQAWEWPQSQEAPWYRPAHTSPPQFCSPYYCHGLPDPSTMPLLPVPAPLVPQLQWPPALLFQPQWHPARSHHPQCTFNVTGLSLLSHTTGCLGQQVEGQWRRMGGLVLGSRWASLREHGVRATTRRGGAACRRGAPPFAHLVTAWGCDTGFGNLRTCGREHHLLCLPSIWTPLLLGQSRPQGKKTRANIPTWDRVQNQSLGRHRAH